MHQKENLSLFSGISEISKVNSNDNFIEFNQEEDLSIFKLTKGLTPFKTTVLPTPIKPVKTMKKIPLTSAKKPKSHKEISKFINIKKNTATKSLTKNNINFTKINSLKKQITYLKVNLNESKPLKNNIKLKLNYKPITPYINKQIEGDIGKEQNIYMKKLDDLYRNKINKKNEVHKKYDVDLIRLKEYIDTDDGQNVNNLIYDSVLLDMKNELQEIDKEFSGNKQKMLKEFNQKNAKIKNKVCKEIENCILNLFSQIYPQVKDKK